MREQSSGCRRTIFYELTAENADADCGPQAAESYDERGGEIYR